MSSLRDWARRLGGEIAGSQVVCPGPRHSARDRSLAVKLSPSAPNGFVTFSFAGDDWRECHDYVRERLGLRREDLRGHIPLPPSCPRRLLGAPEALQPAPLALGAPEALQPAPLALGAPRGAAASSAGPSLGQEEDIRRSRIATALKRWAEGCDPRGTIVEKYLRGRRLALCDNVAWSVIRFHPACPWKDDDGALIRVPAMICAMRNIHSDEIVAVSRRRLTPSGEKVGKPRFLGGAAGAAVKLDADGNVKNVLNIAEGVESGMSGRSWGLKPMWALGSKDAIERFPVLGGVESLSILAEPDAAAQVEKCAARWHAAGREVLIVRPTRGKDLNDAIRGVT